MPAPFLEFKDFMGICNTEDRMRISPPYLEICQNVDIDNMRMLHRRKGYRLVYEGEGIHSLWANQDGSICLFCEGNMLLRLLEDFSTQVLLVNITNEPMNFVEHGRTIYFSNKHIVGYIENGKPYPFPEPNQEFKKRMVGGHLIEVYNNRLYAAQNDKVYFSDATVLTRMDTRKNFLQFDGFITMLKAVYDGLYVGTKKGVYFLKGDDPLNPGFVWNRVSDTPPILGSAIRIEGEKIGKTYGTAVMWASEDGIFLGVMEGAVFELTKGMYSVLDAEKAVSTYCFRNDYPQYLLTYEFVDGKGGGEFELKAPSPKISIKGG